MTSRAQNDCGSVDELAFPVDTTQFRLTQAYAAPSERHEGRYHTGEDWAMTAADTLGQVVRAAARGRVVLASENAWGRDGGVVILEHTFPDGTVYYTQYGHLAASLEHPLPSRLACVSMGASIGVLADVRPAPHLHFEVRQQGANSTTPGAGYTRNHPLDAGYLAPSKFIRNQRTWFSLWHDWHITIGTNTVQDERAPRAPLLVLSDNSTLYLDARGYTLRRATADGRILWRIRLETPAVAVTGWRGNTLLILRDGTLQQVDVETASLGEAWRIEAMFSAPPIEVGDTLLMPTPEGIWMQISPDTREILARSEAMPPVSRWLRLPDGSFAILSPEWHMYYYQADGTLITDAPLRAAADLATSWEGHLIAYTQGGLWQINPSGEWSLYIETVPQHTGNGALYRSEAHLYLFNGSSVSAYNRERQLIWQSNTPPVIGLAEIALYEDILLITTRQGDMVLMDQDGVFCNHVQIFGRDEARQWHHLGTDGRLRLAIADQILALHWERLLRPCR